MDRKKQSLSIQPLHVSDAATLSALAKAIYVEHYLHLWHPGGADWYMHEYAYPEAKLRNELADANNLHYIVYDENKKACGYLKLRINAVLEGREQENCFEIERIYLHRSATGKGIGQLLMQYAEEKARKLNKDLIFLKAMDSSLDAIGFYKKMGYQPCGTLQLPFPLIKEEYRGMLILCKTLEK